MTVIEAVTRIEPARIEELHESLADRVATVAAAAARLGQGLNPRTASDLAGLTRIMNSYYSNLIEGHNTRPRDIERALMGDFETDIERRNLQLEGVAHVRLQTELDARAAQGILGDPSDPAFIRWLHSEFYKGAPDSMLRVEGAGRSFVIKPGAWRSGPEHDVSVGRHIPPSSHRVADFMNHFHARFRIDRMGMAARILAIPTAHHRLNYIHPFPDGNGRVSRLMSHAMAHQAGIGAMGLWSVSRGLARGLRSRTEYRQMMDQADSPRRGDRDGRGNLSLAALVNFSEWFLDVCLDQIRFMTELYDLGTLSERLTRYVERHDVLPPEAAPLLRAALLRGEIERGEAPAVMGLPERTARRLVKAMVDEGILASETPKSALFLRFPVITHETLFPRLFPET